MHMVALDMLLPGPGPCMHGAHDTMWIVQYWPALGCAFIREILFNTVRLPASIVVSELETSAACLCQPEPQALNIKPDPDAPHHSGKTNQDMS